MMCLNEKCGIGCSFNLACNYGIWDDEAATTNEPAEQQQEEITK